MPNVKMTEIEAQYQRINIFKGKQHRLIYYRPMLKKAYQVTKDDVKQIQIYHYRIFIVLFVSLMAMVITDEDLLLTVGSGVLALGLVEAWFYFFKIRSFPLQLNFTPSKRIGFIQTHLDESYKIVNIRIFSYIAITVAAIAGAFVGDYQPLYFFGMMAIAVFGLYQVGILIYVQSLRKKGK
ncbi:MAG: hypothetical protein CVU96_04305 [Firmicutes bacterium HGW-Firmicutes-20]|jgi:hypothetical protein|nr:MAG: hypothetical protein CVU96_04305 [Firmicutes bacterium HGW-Firmicutes-20]PKM89135.1 MAG: hypothetical protein CVU85_03090 [Firmicutes bacterium HGW-Firmicutes-10]